jgi:hypothetical protein
MRAAPQHFGIYQFHQRVRAQARRQSLSFFAGSSQLL